MIGFLKNHISEEEIQEILQIIINQYRNYRHLSNSPEFQNLFAEEYAPHNGKHGISWAISSAFPSEKLILDRLKVRKINYGRGHTRPELLANNIKLHILSDSTSFNSEYLRECYMLNRNNFTGTQLYCFIKFKIYKNQLVNISLCLPDENGSIVAEEIIYDKATLMKIAA